MKKIFKYIVLFLTIVAIAVSVSPALATTLDVTPSIAASEISGSDTHSDKPAWVLIFYFTMDIGPFPDMEDHDIIYRFEKAIMLDSFEKFEECESRRKFLKEKGTLSFYCEKLNGT